jgi:hypothetical protein
VRPLVAIGCVAALAAGAVIGIRLANRTEPPPAVPPLAEPMEAGDPIPPVVEDPRTYPAFDEAYATVCGQTIVGLDVILADPDVVDLAIISSEYDALLQRIASVYEREDLWAATDPLVLEFAETIADDFAALLDGSETGLSYLAGDVSLFRMLCQDWNAPS